MANESAVIDEPTLINTPPVTPPAEETPESKLYPKPDEPKAPDPKTPEPEKPEEPTAPESEPKKEEPKEEPSKPSEPAKPAATDYENLKLPEGNLLSAEEVAATKKEAKEGGLSVEEAQGVLEVKNDAVKAFQTRQNETLKVARQEWKQSWLKDPEFGGDKAAQSTEVAKRAWDRFADSELKTLADQTGMGDHPAVMRMMARIGRLFSEDQMVRGSIGIAGKKKSPEEILYGGTTSNPEPMS